MSTPAPSIPRPRGPVDIRVFGLVPALRRDALLLGALAALGAVALLGQLISAAWTVTAFASGSELMPAVMTFVAVTLVRSALRGVEQTLTARAAGRARVGFGAALVGTALRMTPDRLAETGPGKVSALATNGVDTLEKYVTRYLPAVVPAVLLPPAVIILLAVLDPRSAVIVVVTLPLIPLFAALVGWLTERRSNQQWQLMSRLSAHFLDVVQGLVTLRAYRRADRQVEVLTQVGERHRAATVRVLRIAFLSGTALDLVATLSVGLVAVEAGLRVAAGDLGLGTALLAILIAPEAYRPVRELGARFHESADTTAILDEASALLSAAPSSLSASSGQGALPAGVALLAEGLTVRVPGRAEPVLSGVGLWVLQGQITALTGPSGVGKTTLMRVLAGVITPSAGHVRTDAPLVYLPQRPTFPLARTLRDAVTVAWPAAPGETIDAALRDACALDWITSLEAGLETPLAEDGRDLSAGQRQRIALARTLVQAARVAADGARPTILLDEPTAHLDDVTEAAVLVGLRRWADAGAAVVMVAHRPAAIAAADEVSQLWSVAAPRVASQDRLDTDHHSGCDNRLSRYEKRGEATGAPQSPMQGYEPIADRAAGLNSGPTPGVNSGPTSGLNPGPTLGLNPGLNAGPTPGLNPAPTSGLNPGLNAGPTPGLNSGPNLGPNPGRTSGRPAAPQPNADKDAVLPGFGQAWADARPARSWIPARLRTASMNLAIVLGTLSSLSGVALSAVAAWLLTKASFQPPVLTLTVAVVGVRLFAVTRPVLSYLDRLVAHDVALADLGKLRAQVYADLIPRVPGPALPRRGDLLTRLVGDVDAVGDIVLRWRRPAIVAAATLFVAVIVTAIIDPLAALAAVPGLLLAAVVAPAVAGRGAERRAEQAAAAKAGYAQAVVEVLAGAEDVNALGATEAGVDPVRSAGVWAVEADRAQVRRNALAEFLRMAGAGLAVAGVMLAVAGSSGLSLEQVGVLVLGTLALGDVTATLPDAVNARTRGRIARRRLDEVLETAPPSQDPAVSAQSLEPVRRTASAHQTARVGGGGSAEMAEVLADLEHACAEGWDLDRLLVDLGVAGETDGDAPAVRLDGIVAGWNSGTAPVLNGLDLDLAPGRRIAVQGPSGCGKSTLAGLVLKFLDPRAGTARLGEDDYAGLRGDRIRESVGMVSDDDHVFASTLRENLRLAKPEADDGDLRVALTRARLGGWFNSLPDGLDTWLGERGATMSAGERRRLALARALLADRPVLVLDEPAESLDTQTAQAVLEDMLEAASGRSVLLVTHRAEGLENVDQVLRLGDGRLRAGI